MKISILAVGKGKVPYLDDIDHYLRLLSRYVKLDLVEVRDDQQLIKRLPQRAYTVLLAERGRQYDSLEFSQFIEARQQAAMELVFIIGGAFGTSFDSPDHLLSLGKLTFPHQLAKVLLLEQLYRAHKIIAGERYHY